MASMEVEVEADVNKEPLLKQYQATQVLESKKHQLHNLMKKQPMSLGAVQIVCGICTFGLAIILAVGSPSPTYATVLRIPLLIGILFFCSGWLTAMLYQFPPLLPMCYMVNIGTLPVTLIGSVLLLVDVSQGDLVHPNPLHDSLKVTTLALCVCVLEMCVTLVLIFWLHTEQNCRKGENPV